MGNEFKSYSIIDQNKMTIPELFKLNKNNELYLNINGEFEKRTLNNMPSNIEVCDIFIKGRYQWVYMLSDDQNCVSEGFLTRDEAIEMYGSSLVGHVDPIIYDYE